MLIRNIELSDKWLELKEQVHEVLRKVNGSIDNLSVVYIFILNILLVIPNIAINFKSYQPYP